MTPKPLLLLELKYLHHQPALPHSCWAAVVSIPITQKHHVPASSGRALSSIYSAWQIPRISHPQTLLWFLNHMQLPPKKKRALFFACILAQQPRHTQSPATF